MNSIIFYLKLFLLGLLLLTINVQCKVPVKGGGSFVPTTYSYRHHQFAEMTQLNQQTAEATAWHGERVNFQILLWVENQDTPVRVSATNLRGPGWRSISSEHVKLDFLKFINMNTRDGYSTNPEHIEAVPEMLNGSEPLTMNTGEVQPLWVGVNIPRNAASGIYSGRISIRFGSATFNLPYTINVLSHTVPEVKDWAFDLNLWTHPQATAHYYSGSLFHGQDSSKWQDNVPANMMWSDKHLDLYRPTLEILRDAGLKTITVNLVKDPWRSAYNLNWEQHQTNLPYDEMIHWQRNKNGQFSFDFSNFEKYVKFCISVGIDRYIDCYSMLPWTSSNHSSVTCFDEEQGKEIIYNFKSWEEYEQVWDQFMQAFVPVLIKNGWFEKTRIGVDERGLGNIPYVFKVLRKFPHNGKTLGLIAAAARTHSFDDELTSISMHGGTNRIVNNKWTDKEFADWAAMRRNKGLKSTWYTCTGTYPGNFGNSRPAESLFIGWYTAAIGADGYLRWAVDSWNDNPTDNTDHKVYETGDTFQLYPGDRDAPNPFTRSSVRFELLRQGIVDFEKIRTLKSFYPSSKQELDALLGNIQRPTIPARIKGNSSLVYDDSTINDFSKMMDNATKELNRISIKYTN